MFPVIVHVAISTPSAFWSGFTQENPQLTSQQRSRAQRFLFPGLLPPPITKRTAELSMKSRRRHVCMLLRMAQSSGTASAVGFLATEEEVAVVRRLGFNVQQGFTDRLPIADES